MTDLQPGRYLVIRREGDPSSGSKSQGTIRVPLGGSVTIRNPGPTPPPPPPPPPPPSGNPQPPAGAVKLWTFDAPGPGVSGLPAEWAFEPNMVDIPGSNNAMNRYAMFKARADLIEVSNGTLKVKAHAESGAGSPWGAQSYITTRGRYAHQYGVFRASMKIPAGHALWPAFWGLNATRYDEIDWIEAYPPTDYTTFVHYGGSDGFGHALPSDYATAFHVYETEWRAAGAGDLLISRLDGVEVGRLTTTRHLDAQFLLLQMAVGVWFKNLAPDATTPTNPQLEVDWVGVWA